MVSLKATATALKMSSAKTANSIRINLEILSFSNFKVMISLLQNYLIFHIYMNYRYVLSIPKSVIKT